MAYILLAVLFLPYMVLQMQIGPTVLKTENLRVVTLCFLVRKSMRQ